jgi:methyl coenzyme M reductase alpha subunit
MTESNFAISSVLAALNIVLTVSTTCFWSEVRFFSWALALEKAFGEKIRAKVTANAAGSCDDMEKPPDP